MGKGCARPSPTQVPPTRQTPCKWELRRGGERFAARSTHIRRKVGRPQRKPPLVVRREADLPRPQRCCMLHPVVRAEIRGVKYNGVQARVKRARLGAVVNHRRLAVVLNGGGQRRNECDPLESPQHVNASSRVTRAECAGASLKHARKLGWPCTDTRLAGPARRAGASGSA